MASKLRLNIVCSSRDKRFLVLAEEDWNLEDVKECIELVFNKLYPSEKVLKVSKLQNEFHFDLPQDYTVKDTLADAGLVFAIEQEQYLTNRNQHCSSSEVVQNSSSDTIKQKRKKRGKSPKKSSKRKALTTNDGDCTSSNTVTSTTGSPVFHAEDYNLMPQVVEKDPCEDSDVDIETLED